MKDLYIEEAGSQRHAVDSELKNAALDIAIIAQYQLLCHYGIAGFATTKASAEALDDIYCADGFMTELTRMSIAE